MRNTSADTVSVCEGPASRRAPLAQLGDSLGRTGVVAVLLAVVVLLASAWLYVVVPFTPLTTIPCPFEAATGLECPGCGLQSSLYNLLQLDFRHMLMQNLLSPVLLPLFFYLVISWAAETFFAVSLPGVRLPIPALVVAVAVLVAYWVLRNIPSLHVW